LQDELEELAANGTVNDASSNGNDQAYKLIMDSVVHGDDSSSTSSTETPKPAQSTPKSNSQLYLIDSTTTTKNIQQSWLSCTSVKFQLYDNNGQDPTATKLTIDFDLYLNMNDNQTSITCPSFNDKRSYSVYRDRHQMNIYMFRNIFGEFCMDQLAQGYRFQSALNCFRHCNDVRLEPSGVSSPFQATRVLMLNRINKV
jgi:hypothetical protein